MNRERNTAHAVQALLGLVFFATGIGKAMHFEAFVQAMALLPHVPSGPMMAALVCCGEMILGLLLLGGWRRRFVAGIATGVLAIFVAFTLLAGRTAQDCGCFMGVAPTPSFGWHLTIDVVLLLAAIWLVSRPNLDDWFGGSHPLRPLLSMSLVFLLLAGCGICLRSVVALRKFSSVPQAGERFPEVSWTSREGKDSMSAAREDGLLVVFMRADCPHCAEALPRLRKPVEELLAGGAHVLLVAPDHAGDFAAMTRDAKVAAPVLIEPQESIRSNFHVRSTPTFVWYSHGAVDKVLVGWAGVAAVAEQARLRGAK